MSVRKQGIRAGEAAVPHQPQSQPDRFDKANSGALAPQAPQLKRVIRPGDLHLYTGLSRSQIAILIGQRKFPRPIRLSDRACGWLADEITEWQEEKRRERDGGRQP